MIVQTPAIRFDQPVSQYEGVVDVEDAIAFARATKDELPAYLEGRSIPPLYSAVLVLPALHESAHASIDEGAIRGPDGSMRGVHATHDLHLHRPLHPGERLHWDARIRSVKTNPAGTIYTQQIIVRDTQGRPLVEHLWSTIVIKGVTVTEGGPDLPEHRYPEEARNRMVGSETFDIPRNQGEIYRDAAGDDAGHALSDEIARSEGFPSKILQGMCSFAMASGAVVRIGGGGDPDSLKRLAARFSAPVIQGQDLIVEVAEVGVTDDGLYVVAFEARQGDKLCITHGRAEFMVPA
jgi:acyl dehydratase